MSAPRIIYQNESLLAVEKPSGMLVHGVARGKVHIASSKEQTLVGWLLGRYPEVKGVGDDPKTRPGIVHRLDRATSGILVVAKTQKAFEYLKELFKNREMNKTYLALVWGVPKKKEGTINKSIQLKPGTTRRTVHSGKEGRSAATHYRVLREILASDMKNLVEHNPDSESGALVELRPVTGRTHQIRVHLASIDHPVVGDKKYGRKWERSRYNGNAPILSEAKDPVAQRDSSPTAQNDTVGRMHLHAFSLEFVDIDGTKLHLETELPRWAVNH